MHVCMYISMYVYGKNVDTVLCNQDYANLFLYRCETIVNGCKYRMLQCMYVLLKNLMISTDMLSTTVTSASVTFLVNDLRPALPLVFVCMYVCMFVCMYVWSEINTVY